MNIKKITILFLSIFFLASTSLALAAYYYIHTPVSMKEGQIIFEVKPGSFYQNAKDLREQGLISNVRFFTYYARFRGDAKNIKVGEFNLKRSSSPKQILDKLVSSDYVKYQVTVPEGHNIFEMANIIEASGLAKAEDFLSYVQTANLASELVGVEVPSMEGFLFPNTYFFSKTDSIAKMVATMHGEFKKNYTEVVAANNAIKMDFLDHIILASIIEKETGASFERARVSSVFHNRLKKGMRLQTDPTILYGMMMEDKVWPTNIRTRDIRRPTAYNTYTISGLPPAPIANPGKASLHAALNPEKSDYLFFVSKNDGTHVFTKTYKEHREAVKKYQLDPTARKGKSWRDLKE